MCRIAIVGKYQKDAERLKRRVKQCDFKYTTKDPEYVICFGGDGTFLKAEREYPGVPKLLIKNSEGGKKYSDMELKEILDRFTSNRFKIKQISKLEARIQRGGKTIKRFECVNEFVIRNKRLTRALRLDLELGRRKREVIGDGIIIATHFGSTGYYNSLTRKPFSKGFGIAFNNPTEQILPIRTDEPKIRITITREHAQFSSDNDPDIPTLKKGDKIFINKSRNKARLVVIKR